MNTERELAIDELRDEELAQVVGGDISFTPKIDKASPILMQACCTGTHLKG
jgi:bacteriocin-like protein